jgi:MscS family membrane protein
MLVGAELQAEPPPIEQGPGTETADSLQRVDLQLRSPRDAVRTYLLAMVNNQPQVAVGALDFSQFDPDPQLDKKIEYARMLKHCIDRIALVDLDLLSDQPLGSDQSFPPGDPDAVIRLTRCSDQMWRFAADTVTELPALYDVLKDQPTVDQKMLVEPKKPQAPPESVSGEGTGRADLDVEVPDHLRSARQAMRTLFESLDKKDYGKAVSTLDFSLLEQRHSDLGPYGKIGYARRLRAIIERLEAVDYGAIDDDPNGPPFLFPMNVQPQPIAIVRGDDGAWRFSADTVDNIDSLFEIHGSRPVKERPWYRRVAFMGTEIWRILVLFAAIFISMLLAQAVRLYSKSRSRALKQQERILAALTFETLGKTLPVIIVVIGLAVGLHNLALGFTARLFTGTILHIILSLVVGYIGYRLVDVVVGVMRDAAHRSKGTLNNMLIPIVSASLRMTIVVLVVLEVATVISDKPPSAIIAGLGAGGLAIGLAAQDTIKNFFGSLLIFADRPFELGDRIVIDGHDGPVESVGFRSTRIRTLDGHLVTVPNSEMSTRTVQNIGKRPFIRRIINIRLAYNGHPDQIRQALAILRELLDHHEGFRDSHPPRIFLHDFLESAVNLRVIYWYHPPDYWQFCDYGERLNLQIIERLHAAGIPFALPARQVFVADRTGQQES